MDRKTIFDAVRRLLGRGFRQAEVAALDGAIDAALGAGEPPPEGRPRVSEEGVALIKRFEGCRLSAYPDPGTGGAPWTIGWGTTRIAGEPVTPGMTIDQAEADRLLREDLARHAAEVAEAIGPAPTTPAQFDALVSFHYNTGAIGRATLTRRHRAGDHTGAAHEFRRWTRAGGRVLPGLVRRRAEEAALYLRGSGAVPRRQDGNPRGRRAVQAARGVPTMRHIAAAVAAIALIGSAAVAQGQGQGKGNGQGGGKPAAAANQGGGNDQARGGGQGQGNADRGNRGNSGASMAAAMSPDRGNANRGNSDRANSDRGNSDRGNQDRRNADRGNSGQGADRADNNRGNGGDNARAAQRGNERSAQRADNGNRGNDGRDLVIDRRGGDRDVLRVRDIASIPRLGLIEGCPPGLAKKNPPCVPPGQARNSMRSLFGFDRPDFWGLTRLGDGRYFYDDGYLVRYGPSGGVLGYVPLLGGALSIGNAWPSYYDPVALPGYYENYYGLGPYDSYRYANNVVYRVDPETSAITSIAALLTGDQFAVGQPMPLGYDVYNVPYGYRDRYVDGPGGYYRYSDGYIYQVDPETRLIASVIELLV